MELGRDDSPFEVCDLHMTGSNNIALLVVLVQ